MTILVTGGAGFIGSELIRYLVKELNESVVNVDKLTYAGNLESLFEIEQHPNYFFEQADICDSVAIERIFNEYQPKAVMHLAAESHVDRSIDGPDVFIETNIIGTYNLLKQSASFWKSLDQKGKDSFRFHHISTDEVYGDLDYGSQLFTEQTAYSPSSPYSASKASSDHLVRAWNKTFGLPVIITNCSNNYGPYQFPEKLIPLMILNALEGKDLPVYGKGEQVRDWLYVKDHVVALHRVLSEGSIGETYNIGGHNEMTNLDVVYAICDMLEEIVTPDVIDFFKSKYQLDIRDGDYKSLVRFVTDRPGHDKRYAIDASKLYLELGWKPEETFETGLRKTVQWYLNNFEWCLNVRNGSYQRLGLS